jgi:glycosyltransferase involved in cell wall biosynthesis
METVNVGFYLENQDISSVDLSQPEDGNPGVGGTHFLFVALPHYLKKYSQKYNPIIFANSIDNLPHYIDKFEAKDINKAARKSLKKKCDIFIYRPTAADLEKNFYKCIEDLNLKVVAWAHNLPDYKSLTKIQKSEEVHQLVCVGQEQLDRLRDDKVFKKSRRIFNGFDPTKFIPPEDLEKEKNVVTYIGSLVPTKGFHELAKAWPRVLDKKPNARLKVIGTGKLYNRSQELGKWGVASESYEDKFRKYLSDKNGNIHDSVNFLGLLGKEKIEILQKSTVGVMNPTGKSENCPGSALEIQACGTPVVAGAFWGNLDTIVDGKTGLLSKSDKELADNIVKLLNDEALAAKLGANGIEFVKRKFNNKKIIREWTKLFEDIRKSNILHVNSIQQNPFHKGKYIRESLRILKEKVPPLRIFPSLYYLRKFFASKLKN